MTSARVGMQANIRGGSQSRGSASAQCDRLGFVIRVFAKTSFLAARPSARWRMCVCCSVLLALVWPSLGSLPWALAELAPGYHVLGHEDAEDEPSSASTGAHVHGDASDVPGSPTHPLDHDCAQCQVLKHLSRCVLLPPQVSDVALPTGCPVQPRFLAEPRYEGRSSAALPPVRGPPSRQA